MLIYTICLQNVHHDLLLKVIFLFPQGMTVDDFNGISNDLHSAFNRTPSRIWVSDMPR